MYLKHVIIYNMIIQRTQIIKGVQYVYEDYPYWDRYKKQTRHKRQYVGKLNKKGIFIPNKISIVQQKLTKLTQTSKRRNVIKRTYFGATYLLDKIGEKIGIAQDLKTSFPENYKKILSIAYYLILEDSPLYRFTRWAQTHNHPYQQDIPSQRISELFQTVDESSKFMFFENRSKRRLEQEYLAYDTTSISSYSELIKFVKHGKNKDLDKLPQINLALVFGQKSMLPVYYRKLPGNITDVTTVQKLIYDIKFLNLKKVKLVMDRGFYSKTNIDSLYEAHYKFIIGIKCNNKFVSNTLEEFREQIKDYKNYSIEQDVYCISQTKKWQEHNIYIHVYYNAQRAETEKTDFIKSLAIAEQALIDKTADQQQKNFCKQYFTIKKTKIVHNEEKIRKHTANFGYFILLSNEIKDPTDVLRYYRNKDLIEKAFSNLKNRLEMKRTTVSSDENLEGKLFVQFVALIYMSYIHQHMKKHNLYKNHTMQSLLDELDIIEKFDYEDHWNCREITKKQKELFECFGFDCPNML